MYLLICCIYVLYVLCCMCVYTLTRYLVHACVVRACASAFCSFAFASVSLVPCPWTVNVSVFNCYFNVAIHNKTYLFCLLFSHTPHTARTHAGTHARARTMEFVSCVDHTSNVSFLIFL